ncbi:MAG: histidinol-phosphate transaminase [Spirochaetia bacterium]
MIIKNILNSGVGGIKPYTPGKRTEEVMEELGLERIIKMSSNENAYYTSPLVKEKIKEVSEKVYTYPDSGSRDLTQKIAELHEISPEQITLGNGADGVLRNLCMSVVDQDDEIIIPEITFPLYKSNVEIMRGKPVFSPMKDLRIDTDAIVDRITERTKAIFFCNPNNPTGDAIDIDTVRAFLEKVPSRILVIIDEAYIDFTDSTYNPGSLILFKGGMDNLFIVRSFSKTHGMAGVRLGYGIGQKELVSYVNQIKNPFDVSLLAQTAGSAALEDEEFYNYVVENTKKERTFFEQQLDSLGLSYVSSHTNFFLIDTGVDSEEIFEKLQHKGIIVRPGKNFGLSTHIRVTLAAHEDNIYFFEALKEVLS